ncbi:RNA-binding S4 domain-containing protein [Cloacibacillus sp. An23]|uniref:RNA-binding S4 domain-containing protein n=1 Tax=Cloacibacillus sp. An23 TaxID=1965591 RepID=UPI000B368FAC|nr:RNA-binding S4 domain-containing protein [Cloacibacillus sp. An23]OUO91889.1 RNA-binding protein [Cloacibacillus sp. An23]
MRLDKFLKLSRLIKRRTVAQEMAEVGAVRLNGRQCKPAAEVRNGDSLEVAYPRRVLSVKVECADEAALKRGAQAYTVVDERQVNQDERPW